MTPLTYQSLATRFSGLPESAAVGYAVRLELRLSQAESARRQCLQAIEAACARLRQGGSYPPVSAALPQSAVLNPDPGKQPPSASLVPASGVGRTAHARLQDTSQ